jgi:hypothetical protein
MMRQSSAMTLRNLPVISMTFGAALIFAAIILALQPSRGPAEQALTICDDFTLPGLPDREDIQMAIQDATREGRPILCPTTTPSARPAAGLRPVPTKFGIVAGDGILDYNVTPWTSSINYSFGSRWISSNQPDRTVFAGKAGPAHPGQGLLVVTESGFPKSIASIRPVARTGSLEIVGGDTRVLDIEADDGSRFLFDVDSLTLTFLDGSPVPTQSPYPKR